MPFAWEAFLARYGPMARALARSLVRPPATAEDVVQEAALALHRALHEQPARFHDAAHARNYFLRSVRNLAARSARSAGRETALEHEPSAQDDEALRAVRARQQVLEQLLRTLAPDEQALLARRFLARETLAEAARALGVAPSTLHERERALLARLRKTLEREEERP